MCRRNSGSYRGFWGPLQIRAESGMYSVVGVILFGIGLVVELLESIKGVEDLDWIRGLFGNKFVFEVMVLQWVPTSKNERYFFKLYSG
ncbi:hypothetical protein JTB14_033696 [Gonioctena quinquepunctata]|nr:hypothetical protein JTB14_033696 [Gonioctena quinquepunctata]